MIRLSASLRRDALYQYRQGLYAVTLFLVLVFSVLLSLLPAGLREFASVIVPALLMVNLIITTFYFMAAVVLLEKDEGMASMLVTTPLLDSEYLLSKSLTLTLLGMAETLLIILPFFGFRFLWPPLLFGALAMGMIYCLAGFMAVIRVGSINAFLLPSVPWVTLLMLPLLAHFEILPRWSFFWHPLEPALTLVRQAFAPDPGWEMMYGSAGCLGWTGWFFYRACRAYTRFAAQGSGGDA